MEVWEKVIWNKEETGELKREQRAMQSGICKRKQLSKTYFKTRLTLAAAQSSGNLCHYLRAHQLLVPLNLSHQ